MWLLPIMLVIHLYMSYKNIKNDMMIITEIATMVGESMYHHT